MIQILLDYLSAEVRLVLRVYFNVILAILAILGDQCCKIRSQLRLLRGERLDITQTTGWLRGPSAIYMMYAMRRSPAGWLGFVMLLASAFWLASDLIVTGFVVPVTVVGRCPFNTTSATSYMVTDVKPMGKIGPLVPMFYGTCWDIITAATVTSRRNGGLTGVFRKANTDLEFRANEQDIVLGWQCVVDGQDSTYPNSTDPGLIIDDLISQDLLYGNYTSQATTYIGGSYLQLAVWSSSVGDWSGELSGLTPQEIIDSPILHPWDVRAAIDLSKRAADPRLMRSYHCFLNDTSMDFVLGKIQAGTALNEMIDVVRSNIYGYFTDNVPLPGDPAVAIASTLDTLLMAGSAYQAGLNTPAPQIEDPYQGCLKQKAQIPMAVIVIFATVTATTIFILLYWLVLLRQVRTYNVQNLKNGKVFTGYPPYGLLGWMIQAVRNAGAEVQADGLSSWTLFPSVDRRRLELRKETEDGYAYLQQAPTPLSGQSHVSYEAQKAGYVEIRRFE